MKSLLRTLLVVAVAGSGMSQGLLAQDAGKKNEVAEAERWIRSIGGTVYGNFVKPELPSDSVHLSRTKVKDEDLAKLAVLKSLTYLALTETDISDAGVKHLAALKGLKHLYLTGTKATGKHLRQLTKLRTLEMDRCLLNDQGLEEVGFCKDLEVLRMRGTKVTDAGINNIRGLKKLRFLGAGDTKITDVGLKDIALLNGLDALELQNLNVTDVGVKELAVLKRLCWLDLTNAKITDAVAPTLAALESIQYIKLDGTGIGDAAFIALVKTKRKFTFQSLSLARTKVTDEGIKELREQKYLHTLNLAYCEIRGAGLKDLAKNAPVLSKLDLRKTPISDAALADVAKLPLGELNLAGCRVGDEGVKNLRPLKYLHVLNLSETDVTDLGAKELRSIGKRKDRWFSVSDINLASTRITDVGLMEFENWGVAYLKVANCKISEKALVKVFEKRGFEQLDLSGTEAGDAVLEALARIERLPGQRGGLEKLAVAGTRMTEDAIRKFKREFPYVEVKTLENATKTSLLPDQAEVERWVRKIGGTSYFNFDTGLMETVDLSGTKVKDEDLAKLAVFKSLLTLRLSETEISDGGVKHVAALTELKTLDLGGTKATGKHLKQLAKLRYLTMDRSRLNDEGLQQVAGCKEIDGLFMRGTKVTDAGMKYVSALKKIHVLHAGDTKITDVGLKEIAVLDGLKRLELQNLKVTDAGVKELALLKSLFWLDLMNAKVTDAIGPTLAALDGIQYINLEGAGIGDAAFIQLARPKRMFASISLARTKVSDDGIKALRGQTQLHTLNLAYCPIKGPGLKHLAKNAPVLSDLDLRGTLISDAALADVAELPVSKLNLSGCRIGDEGVKNLKRSEKLDFLHFLDLSETDLTDAGARELRWLIRPGDVFKHVFDLNLASTKITDVGLMEVVFGHWGVTYLGLANCKISEKALLKILEKLETRGVNGLTGLDLSGTEAGDAVLQALTRIQRLPPANPTSGGLEKIVVARTRMTPEAIEKFKRSFPYVKVKTK